MSDTLSPISPLSLDPRFIPQQQVIGWIVTAAVAGGSLVGLGIFLIAADDAPAWVRWLVVLLWPVVVGAFAWHGHRWPVREYAHTSYQVDPQGIEIRRGVYWRVVINVPRSRVQHIDVTQGPIERRYGLGTLAIYTAGTDHARVALAGLEHGQALQLREQLLPATDADAV